MAMNERITNLTVEGNAQPVQRGLRGAKDDSLALAMKLERSRFMALLLSDAYPDHADGFFFASAGRSGNASDTEADTRAGALPNASRHFQCGLFAHGAMFFQGCLTNAEKFYLRFVGIGHCPTVVVGRAAGDSSNAMTDQTAGTGFSEGQGLVFHP